MAHWAWRLGPVDRASAPSLVERKVTADMAVFRALLYAGRPNWALLATVTPR